MSDFLRPPFGLQGLVTWIEFMAGRPAMHAIHDLNDIKHFWFGYSCAVWASDEYEGKRINQFSLQFSKFVRCKQQEKYGSVDDPWHILVASEASENGLNAFSVLKSLLADFLSVNENEFGLTRSTLKDPPNPAFG